MKKKTKITVDQPNVIRGYDLNGNMTMFYWQKEPIVTRMTGVGFSIPKRLWWNPIWRMKQWAMMRKPIQFSDTFFGKENL